MEQTSKGTKYKTSRAVIAAQEKECNRISIELHDNVNQLVLAARLHIGMARMGSVCREEALKKAEDYLLQVIEAIKAMTHRLNSSIEARGGLEKVIAETVEMMSVLHVEVQVNISPCLVAKLNADQQLMVCRIVQEQASNILQYSEATEAAITLRQVDNTAELLVSDKGKGFDKEKLKTGGIGFINILNRVQACKGSMEIETAPGNGCLLVVKFPLDN